MVPRVSVIERFHCYSTLAPHNMGIDNQAPGLRNGMRSNVIIVMVIKLLIHAVTYVVVAVLAV